MGCRRTGRRQAYWEAYNRADPDGMNTWLASDVEFYHDRGGKVIGKKALSAVNDGMKSAPVKLRREAVQGTIRFFPMRQGETLYGAIVTGEHRFYARPAGAPETLAGHANFSHLMLLQGKQWRISRISATSTSTRPHRRSKKQFGSARLPNCLGDLPA